jgi:hypothetical protein
MKKELYLFEGKKAVKIDYELYNCYELFVDEFTDRKLEYLTHVLELTEDMSEQKLSECISEVLYEEIYMITLMEDDLIAAMKKMIAEEKQKIKVVKVKDEMPEDIKDLLNQKEVIKLTICARKDAHISSKRIEKGLACLYKCIKCTDIPLWIEKRVEENIAKEISVVVEETRLSEIMELIRSYVCVVFECDDAERVVRIYV